MIPPWTDQRAPTAWRAYKVIVGFRTGIVAAASSGTPGIRGAGNFFMDNLVVDSVNVPEPGTLALFAAGGLGLLARRRRVQALTA